MQVQQSQTLLPQILASQLNDDPPKPALLPYSTNRSQPLLNKLQLSSPSLPSHHKPKDPLRASPILSSLLLEGEAIFLPSLSKVAPLAPLSHHHHQPPLLFLQDPTEQSRDSALRAQVLVELVDRDLRLREGGRSATLRRRYGSEEEDCSRTRFASISLLGLWFETYTVLLLDRVSVSASFVF